jgi:hypothetical protein
MSTTFDEPYSEENYNRYCDMVRRDFPGIHPSSFDQWVAFNKAIDGLDEGEE